jgi:pSer/pThr/pTyr-binding forkhead associated (FHA) protein
VKPKLVVLRGMRLGAEYPLYDGRNVVGRFADKPVDIDLVSQEAVEQIWCSRQHAVLVCEKGAVSLEDLNSLNGTWLNGARVHAGQPRPVKPGDVVQIGTVQMKLVVG